MTKNEIIVRNIYSKSTLSGYLEPKWLKVYAYTTIFSQFFQRENTYVIPC